MSSGTACSGVGHGNAPQGAGLTSARGDRNRGPCSPCPAGYDAGTWMGRAAMGDGFLALYIFMLAPIAGHVTLSSSDERRVGIHCVSRCTVRWLSTHYKKKKIKQKK